MRTNLSRLWSKVIFAFLGLGLISFGVMAQSPLKFSYQAVIRDGDQELVKNQTIGVQISIFQGTPAGVPVFVETHAPTSNSNGLVSLQIGTGSVQSGTMAGIDWSNGPFFLESATDPTGGTNYSVVGATELLSVPYALYAATAGNNEPGPMGPEGPKGETGPEGPEGPQGPIGLTGAVGPAGPIGPEGPKGETGPEGPEGPQGPIGLTGAVGPAGPIGPEGPKGETGPEGPEGPQGPIGLTGAVGPAGPMGPEGPKGETGPEGPEGPQGPIGLTGAVGPAGPMGPEGPKGETGPEGPEGPQGPIGLTGAVGPAGPIGPEGPKGETGPEGPEGPQGPIGLTGAVGPAGPIGPEGPKGETGPEGPQGPQGPPGDVADGALPEGASGNFLVYGDTNWIARDIVLGNTGANQSFSIMQPYTTVNFIIALQGLFPSRNAADPFLAQIIMFAGNFAPRGWAFCDGQLLPISQNQAVFALIGTIYGGDGRTTFALPDLRGRVPMHEGLGPGLPNYRLGEKGGSPTATLNVLNLPSHTHTLSANP